MFRPLIFIFGSTGSGKSKLAIELALKFNGEIISADSMQIYKDLNIVSNKVSKNELKLVKHHFISILDSIDNFTIHDFKIKANEIIKNLHQNNKLPIVVGGTYYYMESIMYDFLIDDIDFSDDYSRNKYIFNENKFSYTDEMLKINNFFNIPIFTNNFDNVDSTKLYEILKQIDCETAERLHPNDKRKIIRSLQIYQRTKVKKSVLMKNKNKDNEPGIDGGYLKYPNCIILNLNCDLEILKKRIYERVDKMIELGLLDEIKNFYIKYNELNSKNSFNLKYTKGILQMIGFKEFHKYLIDENPNQLLLNKCIEKMKIATKKYAKKQNRWFINRFLSDQVKREVPKIFNLNVNNLDLWNENVLYPASKIVHSLIINKSTLFNEYENLIPLKIKMKENILKFYYCHICDLKICGSLVWEKHINSKKHKYLIKIQNNSNQKSFKLIKINIFYYLVWLINFLKKFIKTK